MPQGPPLLSPKDVQEAHDVLARCVASTPRGWGRHLPAQSRVHVTRIEDGWVHLRPTGNPLAVALSLADGLLLPGAVLVAHTETDCTVDGFAALQAPPPTPITAAEPCGDSPPSGGNHWSVQPLTSGLQPSTQDRTISTFVPQVDQ